MDFIATNSRIFLKRGVQNLFPPLADGCQEISYSKVIKVVFAIKALAKRHSNFQIVSLSHRLIMTSSYQFPFFLNPFNTPILELLTKLMIKSLSAVGGISASIISMALEILELRTNSTL